MVFSWLNWSLSGEGDNEDDEEDDWAEKAAVNAGVEIVEMRISNGTMLWNRDIFRLLRWMRNIFYILLLNFRDLKTFIFIQFFIVEHQNITYSLMHVCENLQKIWYLINLEWISSRVESTHK